MIVTVLRRGLAAFCALALLCASAALAATTPQVTVGSDRWYDLGAGPATIQAQATYIATRWRVDDAQPALSAPGLLLQPGVSQPIETTAHIWAKTDGSSIGNSTIVLVAPRSTTAPGAPSYVGGSYFTNVPSAVLTRANNATAYAANETVCAFASATPCAPLAIPIGNAPGGKGVINHVSLLKSGGTLTNASFTVWFYSAAPGAASPSQFDATAYAGPRAADLPNYIGSAQCSAPAATSDTTAQVWFECILSNPNTGGALDFQALYGSTNIDALISVTAAYAPAAQETFIVFVSGFY